MALHQQHQPWFLYFLLSVSPLILACSDDDLFVIKSAAYRSLVLDGSDSSSIKIQNYTGSPSQLWKFERGKHPGLFYIINKKTNNAIDFDLEDVVILIARPPRNVLRQQWNWTLKGRITNAENKRNMDVDLGNFVPGNRVILWDDNGRQAQEFLLERVYLNALDIPTNES